MDDSLKSGSQFLNKNQTSRLIFSIAIVALLYYLFARLGLSLAIPPGFATALWPPSGLAVAAVFFRGYKMAVGIFLGSFCANLYVSLSLANTELDSSVLLIAGGIAIGSALQAIAAKLSVDYFLEKKNFYVWETRHLSLLLINAGFISCFVSATLGNLTLLSFDIIESSHFLWNWFTWWSGDVLGVFVFTPCLLILTSPTSIISKAHKVRILLPVSILFILSITFYFLSITALKKELSNELRVQSNELTQIIQNKLNTFQGITESFSIFYATMPYVSYSQFTHFSSELSTRYPIIDSTYWAPLVTDKNIETLKTFLFNDKSFHPSEFIQKKITSEFNLKSIPNQAVLFTFLTNKTASDHSQHHQNKIIERLIWNKTNNIPKLNNDTSAAFEKSNDSSKLIIASSFKQVNQEGLVLVTFSLEPLLQQLEVIFVDTGIQLLIFHKDNIEPIFQWPKKGLKSSSEFQRKLAVALGNQTLDLHFSFTPDFISSAHFSKLWSLITGAMALLGIIVTLTIFLTNSTIIVEYKVKEQTNQINRERRLLDSIIDNLPLYLTIKKGDNLTFERLNKVMEKEMGLVKDDYLGKSAFDLLDSDAAKKALQSESRAIRLNQPINIPEESLETKSGKRWLHTQKIPIYLDENRQASYLLSISQDITDYKLQNETLLKKQKELDTIFSTFNDMYFWISKDGIISDFRTSNHSLIDILPQQFLGKPLANALPKRISKQYVHYLKILDETSSPQTFGYWITVNNRSRFYESRLALLNSDFRLCIMRDITDQKELEKQLQQGKDELALLLDSVGDGIYGIDLNGEATFINRVASQLLGFDTDELIGKNMHAMIHHHHQDGSESPSSHCPIYAAIKQGVIRRIEEDVFWRKNGSQLLVEYVSTPIRQNGEITGAVVVFKDIGDRKHMEYLLKQKNDRLTQINEELETFSYVASHDLREPLRTVKSFSGFLAEDIKNNDMESVNKDISFIQSAIQRMSLLIEDLLDLSRANRHVFERIPTELNKCLSSAVDNLQALIRDSNASIEIQSDFPQIIGDQTQLTRVFQNVMHNSIKFCEADKTPSIEISFAYDSSKMLSIYFDDNGIGIDDKYKSQVFAAFKRLNTKDLYEGSGIGLTVVKKIIERHKGNVIVADSLMGGARIIIQLPILELLNVNKGKSNDH